MHDIHYISSLLPFSYPLLDSQYGWYPLYEALSPNILDRLLYHAVPVEKNIRCLNKIVVFLFYMIKIINIGNNMFFVDSKKPIYAKVDLFNLNDLRLTTKAPVSLLSSVIWWGRYNCKIGRTGKTMYSTVLSCTHLCKRKMASDFSG